MSLSTAREKIDRILRVVTLQPFDEMVFDQVVVEVLQVGRDLQVLHGQQFARLFVLRTG